MKNFLYLRIIPIDKLKYLCYYMGVNKNGSQTRTGPIKYEK